MLAEAFKHFKKEQRGFLALFVCLKTLSNILRRYSEAFQHYSTSMQADFKPFLRLIEAVKAFQYEPAVDCSQMVFNAEKNPQRIKNLMPYTLFSRKGWLDLTVFLKKNCKKHFLKACSEVIKRWQSLQHFCLRLSNSIIEVQLVA